MAGTLGTTRFDYDAVGNVTKVTLPDWSTLSYTYDGAHRLTQIQDTADNKLVLTLDAMGNRTKEELFDPNAVLAHTRSRVFDALNRLWKDIGTLNQTTEYAYDANGNLTSGTDPLGRTTSYGFDALNRLASLTDPAGGQTRFGYDGLDQLNALTDPRNLRTSYAVSGLGERLGVSSPDTGATLNTFDAAGNLVSATDARGVTAVRTYDALNRLIQLQYPDQSLVFTWDSTPNGVGRLAQATDASGSTQFAYDALGRVATVTHAPANQPPLAVGYRWNNADQLVGLTLPSGRQLTYSYWNRRVVGIQLDGQALVGPVFYRPHGGFDGYYYNAGQWHYRQYDLDGRILWQNAGNYLKSYHWDLAGRLFESTDNNWQRTQSFSYDSLDRLVQSILNTTVWGYAYDAAGNRTQSHTAWVPEFYQADSASNRLLARGSRAYLYDAAGHQLSDGVIADSYDAAGRLVRSQLAASVTSYRYNAWGQRTEKAAGTTLTRFAYDVKGHLVGEYNQAGAPIQEFVWLDDLPVALLDYAAGSPRVHHIVADHLGTPREVTDGANRTVWRWEGEPFGVTAPQDDPDGDGVRLTLNLRFPGQYFDAETNRNYNYFRDYDPGTGRYVQSDPIGLAGGVNTYSYVGGNPLSFIDFFGLDRQATGPAIVWTDMSGGRTVFYDPVSQDYFQFPTNNDVTPNSKPGAAGPYNGVFTYCQYPNTDDFGTAKWRTTDSRQRWVHGGGTGLSQPLAPRQGWRPTLGCTRAQNEDVEKLCSKSDQWTNNNPGRPIPYSRW